MIPSPFSLLHLLASSMDPLSLDAIRSAFDPDWSYRIESMLLNLLDQGLICEPEGEYDVFRITEAGRAELMKLEAKPEVKPETQRSLFA